MLTDEFDRLTEHGSNKSRSVADFRVAADLDAARCHVAQADLYLEDNHRQKSWPPRISRLPFPSNQAAFFCCFCVCCGYVGNAFALSKRSGISTVAASILSMPARHAAMGNLLFIA